MHLETVQQLISIALQVVGGLGIFLLGMKNMSEGVQAVAGARLRRWIGLATNNRLVACGVGALVTCFVQSSSITTVMVVGLVNVGVMTLFQAFGVIMGANIGTTITGWVLVLQIGKYGLPMLGVAAFFFLFAKRDRFRYTAMTVMGLGMVFFGLELMKDGFAPLSEAEGFKSWFSAFSPHSYFGVLRCCLVGAVLTAIVQSSSATLGITIGLAATGVIDFNTAAALVLGENIGTTITAWLASLGGSINARRASYAHIMFNIVGVAWITAVFPVYIWIITVATQFIYGGVPSEAVIVDGVTTWPYITAGIASVHTGFNVLNVLFFLPVMAYAVKALERMIPERRVAAPSHLTYFDVGLVDTPALGLQQSGSEIAEMARNATEMLDTLRPVIAEGKDDEQIETALFRMEEEFDVLQREIFEFLSHLLSGNVPQDVTQEGLKQLRLADEYESISDDIVTVLKLAIKLRKQDIAMAEAEQRELADLHDHVAAYTAAIREMVDAGEADVATARAEGDTITHLMKEYRANHLDRMGAQSVGPFESLIITDMLNAYRRIKEHGLNIAETLAGV